MKKFKNFMIPCLLVLFLFIFQACESELEVPLTGSRVEQDLALQSAREVGTLAKDLYRRTHSSLIASSNSLYFSNIWDHYTSSSSFLFREEPRSLVMQNQMEATYAYLTLDLWTSIYRVVAYTLDVLGAEKLGVKATDNITLLDITNQTYAMAYLNHGLLHGNISLLYEKGWLLEPGTKIGEFDPKVFTDYKVINAKAIEYIKKAIEYAEKGAFTFNPAPTEASYFYSMQTITNIDFIAICNSHIARLMSGVARTEADRAALDWAAIKSYAEKGWTKDLAPYATLVAPLNNVAYSYANVVGATTHATSSSRTYRVNMRLVGMADTTGAYAEYLAKPFLNRTAFVVKTPDYRVRTPLNVGKSTQEVVKYFRNQALSTWTGYGDAINSSYLYDYDFVGNNFAFKGQMGEFRAAESRLILAEALYRLTPAHTGCAAVVNETRVKNGKLNPTIDADPELFMKLQWEKFAETFATNPLIVLTDKRGWGLLIEGTAYQLAIPGKTHNINNTRDLIEEFGGVGGKYAAPKEKNIIFSKTGFNKKW